MTHEILTHKLANGLALVAEPMPWLESAAFALLAPAGCARDPADQLGLANFTCEMVQRGCGDRNSREFVEDLELLGADTSGSVSNSHTSFGGAMPAAGFYAVLEIYADVVRRPQLPPHQLEEARQVCLHEIRAAEDDLAQTVMIELRRRRYGDPFGRAGHGELAAVEKIQLADLQRHFATHYRPDGAILGVAGKLDWPRLRDEVERLFGDWSAHDVDALVATQPPPSYRHLESDSSQTHIGVAFPSVPYAHPDYFQARGAVGVLSDGTSSRLFTEVREKRGLVYSVHAHCHSLRDRGSVMCYAGTTTERAQETLDVLIAELVRLGAGIQQAELNRLQARIKSALIMQQESSTARSSAIAFDWYFLERVRTLDEIGALIDGLTCDSINAYLGSNPPRDFTTVTLGEKQLEVPVAVS